MALEWFVAGRHLRSTGSNFLSTIAVIATIGVALGVCALTSVIAVTGGFEEAFRERVLGAGAHVLVLHYGNDFYDYRDRQEQIEAIDGVKATSPFVFHEMIATAGSKSAGVLVKGVDPKTMARVTDLPRYVRGGGGAEAVEALTFDRFPSDGVKGTAKILLGATLADRLGVKRGDSVRVTSPLASLEFGSGQGNGGGPSTALFEIAGVYASGFHEYDNRLAITDYRALQDFFGQGDVVRGIDVRVDEVLEVGKTVERIQGGLASTKFRILDWRELNHNLFTSLGLQRLVLAVLFCFIVLVASFNIACTLIMIVLDKQKEVAVLQSMGAPRSTITRVFLIQGAAIGALGTAIGLVCGVLVCLAVRHSDFGLDPSIYMIDHLPVRMVWWEFAAVGALAMFISVSATLGPALWASRLRPIDGLRYEG